MRKFLAGLVLCLIAVSAIAQTVIPGVPTSGGASIPVRGAIFGCTLSNDGTSPNTVIDVTTCYSTSDDGTVAMSQGSAYTKTTGAWAVGTGNGSLDTGTIAASTWYHEYQIQRTDGTATDYLLSLSPSSPTMPSGYTLKRRIGSIKTNGSSQIIAFTQNGDEFLWGTQVVEVNGTAVSATTASTLTLAGIPSGTGLRVNALLTFLGVNGSASAVKGLITPLDASDNAATINNTSLNFGYVAGASQSTPVNVRALAGQVRIRFDTSGAGITYYLNTAGWIDTRGK